MSMLQAYRGTAIKVWLSYLQIWGLFQKWIEKNLKAKTNIGGMGLVGVVSR